AIDSDAVNSVGHGGYYGGWFQENKAPDASWSQTTTAEAFRGNIILNVKSGVGASENDYSISNTHTISDMVIWDSRGGYAGGHMMGDPGVVNAPGMTVGKIGGKYDVLNGQPASGTGFEVQQGVAASVTNSIFWHNPSYGIADYVVGDYNSFFDNGADYGGA